MKDKYNEMKNELRSGIPDRNKASKKALTVGGILFLIGLLNVSKSGNPFAGVTHLLMISGIFLLFSAFGMKNKMTWGEDVAKSGVIIAIAGIGAGSVMIMAHMLLFAPMIKLSWDIFSIITVVMIVLGCTLVGLQFIIPLSLGLGYLTRLKKQRIEEDVPGKEYKNIEKPSQYQMNDPGKINNKSQKFLSKKKVIIGIVILELILIIFSGPVMILMAKMEKKGPNVVFYKSGQYQSDNKWTNGSYTMAEITYDEDKKVIKESFYTFTGIKETFYIKDNKIVDSDSLPLSYYFIFGFAIVGFFFLAFGQIVYAPLMPYGVALLAPAFVMGMIFTGINSIMLG
jgi:hypothetical protein